MRAFRASNTGKSHFLKHCRGRGVLCRGGHGAPLCSAPFWLEHCRGRGFSVFGVVGGGAPQACVRHGCVLKGFTVTLGRVAEKGSRHGGAWPRFGPVKSPTTVQSVGMLRRVRLHAIQIGFRAEIFENFSRPRNFEVGTRRNPCRLVTRSLLTTLRGPQRMCRASACCGA